MLYFPTHKKSLKAVSFKALILEQPTRFERVTCGLQNRLPSTGIPLNNNNLHNPKILMDTETDTCNNISDNNNQVAEAILTISKLPLTDKEKAEMIKILMKNNYLSTKPV